MFYGEQNDVFWGGTVSKSRRGEQNDVLFPIFYRIFFHHISEKISLFLSYGEENDVR